MLNLYRFYYEESNIISIYKYLNTPILRDTTTNKCMSLSYMKSCNMFTHNMFNANYTVLSYGIKVLKFIIFVSKHCCISFSRQSVYVMDSSIDRECFVILIDYIYCQFFSQERLPL